MTIENKYFIELEKVSFLKDVPNKYFGYSDTLLFREYQSRLFKWKCVLKPAFIDLFNKSKPFHNLFLDMEAHWLNQLITEEKVVSDLSGIGVKNLSTHFRYFTGFFISMYINWELFKNEQEIKSHLNLSHPYEPVFKLISRGGDIYSSDRKFELSLNGQTYLNYNKDFKMPSIDDAFLNFVDANCSDFPNQERVNFLWEEFKQRD